MKKSISQGHQKILAIVIAFVIMCATYCFNLLDSNNIGFRDFQMDSQQLVTGTIESTREGWKPRNDLGIWIKQEQIHIADISTDEFKNGFSIQKPVIALTNNDFVQENIVAGNYISFGDTDKRKIVSNDVTEKVAFITLEGTEPIVYNVDAKKITITSTSGGGEVVESIIQIPYNSQVGLHCKIFSFFQKIINQVDLIDLYMLAVGSACAMVLVAISYFVYKKFNNKLLGMCFYLVFLLSPWIVNFARNLYWIEFTWFLPMLCGLIYAYKPKWFWQCTIAGAIAIFIKCLCGYEYITTIMIGFILFPMVDLFTEKSKKRVELFKKIFIMGILAMLAFLIATMIHALVRGEGDMIEGYKGIISRGLTRTIGLMEDGTTAFHVSTFTILKTYLRFPNNSIVGSEAIAHATELILGMRANLFTPLIIIASLIFGYKIINKKVIDKPIFYLFIFSFLGPISWFVIANAHSVVHIYLNYVLWYFGFVQVLLYIIIDFIREIFLLQFQKNSIKVDGLQYKDRK